MSKAKRIIEGIKLIRHNANRINNPDDPRFPYRLEVILRPPEFMEFMFVGLFGGSEIVIVRGMTKEAIEEFVNCNDFRTHPRLIRLTITGPEGTVEELDKNKR